MKDDIGGAYLLVHDDIEVTCNSTRRLAPTHDMVVMSCRFSHQPIAIQSERY